MSPCGGRQEDPLAGVNAAGLCVSRVAGSAHGSGLPTLLEAVALPVHLQDVNAVSETVHQGAGQPLRAEDLGPLVKGLTWW